MCGEVASPRTVSVKPKSTRWPLMATLRSSASVNRKQSQFPPSTLHSHGSSSYPPPKHMNPLRIPQILLQQRQALRGVLVLDGRSISETFVIKGRRRLRVLEAVGFHIERMFVAAHVIDRFFRAGLEPEIGAALVDCILWYVDQDLEGLFALVDVSPDHAVESRVFILGPEFKSTRLSVWGHVAWLQCMYQVMLDVAMDGGRLV